MHPEAATLSAEDLLFKEHPDLVQLETDFSGQAEMLDHPGHGPGCECDHHNANAYIDHPEDHLLELIEVHAESHPLPAHNEADHGHTEHQDHPDGCRCGIHSHEDIGQDNFIESPHIHNPDGSCCGKPSGEAKHDIDTNEHHHEVHIEAERGHAGSRHVDHEDHPHEAVAVGHPGDCHCASCTPAEAKHNIDPGNCTTGNCGHEHHSKVGPTVDQERAHDHGHIPDEEIQAAHHGHGHADQDKHQEHHHIAVAEKPEDAAAHHAIREGDAFQSPREADVVRQQVELEASVVREHIARPIELEEWHVQSLEPDSVVQPDMVDVAAYEAQLHPQVVEADMAFVADAGEVVAQTVEQPVEESLVDVQDEALATVIPEASSNTIAPVEIEVAAVADTTPDVHKVDLLDALPESNEILDVVEEPSFSELLQETVVTPQVMDEAVIVSEEAEPEPDLIKPSVIEAPSLIVDEVPAEENAYRKTQESIATIFDVPEQAQPREEEQVEKAVKSEQLVVNKEVPEFAAVEEQFEVFEKTVANRRPEAFDEMHKSIVDVYAALHDGASEVNVDKVSQEVFRLLSLLGFENPGETLNMYLQQYGISTLEGMLSRLFELLRQSRSVEVAASPFSLFTTPVSSTQSTQGIGKAVLAVLVKLQHVQSARRKGLALAA